MSIQYITDSDGIQTGVIIPLDDWNELLQRHPDVLDTVGDEIPQWHKDLVLEELRKLESGESATVPWEQVYAELRQKYARG